MAKNNKRVVRYRTPININAGIVIFGIIFLYVAINVVIYFSKERVTSYEVVLGSVADDSNHSYTAIALRQEKVFFAENSGYINFYARDNSRISTNTTLYSIDESGKINELLLKMSDEEKTLSEENINTVKDQLYSFVTNFDEMNYQTVYDFKSSLQGTVVELINMNALQSIYASLGESKKGQFEIKKAGSSGIVEYYIDNYETVTPETLNASHFDESKYNCARIENGDIIEAKAPIYKTLPHEQWDLAIQLSSEDVDKYSDTTAVKIRFKKDNTTVTTNFKIVKGSDNKNYGILTLQKYMIRFADQRFVDIEIIEDDIKGLKIPKKSVIDKEFFVIPVAYKMISKEQAGFIKRVYDEETVSDVFVPIKIYNQDDKYCYVDKSDLEAGDEIILPTTAKSKKDNKDNKDDEKQESSDIEDEDAEDNESEDSSDESSDKDSSKYSETYIIRDKQTLSGVYNINNGYTQFVYVDILTEAGEYYIVKYENSYGLVVYDHIILNGNMVKENQVIFQ